MTSEGGIVADAADREQAAMKPRNRRPSAAERRAAKEAAETLARIRNAPPGCLSITRILVVWVNYCRNSNSSKELQLCREI